MWKLWGSLIRDVQRKNLSWREGSLITTPFKNHQDVGIIDFIRTLFSISRLPRILNEAGGHIVDGGNRAVEIAAALKGDSVHPLGFSQMVEPVARLTHSASRAKVDGDL